MKKVFILIESGPTWTNIVGVMDNYDEALAWALTSRRHRNGFDRRIVGMELNQFCGGENDSSLLVKADSIREKREVKKTDTLLIANPRPRRKKK